MTLITEARGQPDKVFLVTGKSTAHPNAIPFAQGMLQVIKSQYSTTEIVNVEAEPYYVDMCVLSLCGSNIISNSSFSLSASLIDHNDKKTVIYPNLLTRQLGLRDFKCPGFQELS